LERVSFFEFLIADLSYAPIFPHRSLKHSHWWRLKLGHT